MSQPGSALRTPGGAGLGSQLHLSLRFWVGLQVSTGQTWLRGPTTSQPGILAPPLLVLSLEWASCPDQKHHLEQLQTVV